MPPISEQDLKKTKELVIMTGFTQIVNLIAITTRRVIQMTFVKHNAGLLRSVRSWRVLGLLLALAVTIGLYSGAPASPFITGNQVVLHVAFPSPVPTPNPCEQVLRSGNRAPGPPGTPDPNNMISLAQGPGVLATILSPKPPGGTGAYDVIGGTQYIGWQPNGQDSNGIHIPPGDTWFRTTFALPNGLINPILIVVLHADNAATVWLNGNIIEAQPFLSIGANLSNPPETFTSTNPGNFLPGNNILDFQVHNFEGPVALDYKAIVECDPPPCDLAIMKEVNPNPVPSGSTVAIKLTVTNVGKTDCLPGFLDLASPGTLVLDNQPAGLIFNPAPLPVIIGGPPPPNNATWAPCGIMPNPIPGVFSCFNPNTLPMGYGVMFTFTATVMAPAGSQIQNCASVLNPNDTIPANNQDCVTISVGKGCPPNCLDLILDKTLDGELRAEQQATYMVKVTNISEGPTTGTSTVLDQLPSSLALVSVGGTGWTCIGFGQLVTCTTSGPLAPKQSSTIQITVKVNAKSGTEIKNCAVVDTEGDANKANNQGCHTATVK